MVLLSQAEHPRLGPECICTGIQVTQRSPYIALVQITSQISRFEVYVYTSFLYFKQRPIGECYSLVPRPCGMRSGNEAKVGGLLNIHDKH